MSRRLCRGLHELCALAMLVAFAAAPVLAATNPQEEASTTTGWIYRWINFSIFAALIVWGFTNKGTRGYFRNRQKGISDAIAESARAREEAERQEREAEQKMASLDREVADLRSRAKQESAAEAERIRALAREDAKRIEQSAQLEIRAAERAAQMQLKAIAARMAVERAEDILRNRVTAQTDSTLFRGFVSALEGSAN